MTNKHTLKELLHKSILSINFTKADGTLRKMVCTLREDLVQPHEKKTTRVKKPNENILAVWDVNKDAFRSFKLDSLIDYQVLEEGYEL